MAITNLDVIVPRKIRVEASSACQLRCPVCPTGQGLTHKNACGTGFLSFDNFKRLLVGNKNIKEIELSNWGEVFINPELPEILEHAHRAKIKITIMNGANLNNVSETALESVVKFGVDELVVALDGATKEVYKIYRKRGDFDRVIDNVKTINKFKREYNTDKPRLVWQFIIFGHNEHEINAAKQLAKELDMTFSIKLNVAPEYSPVINAEKVMKDANTTSVRANDDWGTSICNQLWKSPQINWDGKIFGCCNNNWLQFGGNAFDESLVDCLNSEKIKYARRMLEGKAAPMADIPCSTCEAYLSMVKNKKWVNMTRIRVGMVVSRFPMLQNAYKRHKRTTLPRIKSWIAFATARASRSLAPAEVLESQE